MPRLETELGSEIDPFGSVCRVGGRRVKLNAFEIYGNVLGADRGSARFAKLLFDDRYVHRGDDRRRRTGGGFINAVQMRK